MTLRTSVAICVPYYKNKLSKLEQFSFNQIRKQFQTRKIVLVGPIRIENTLATICTKGGSNYSYQAFPNSYFDNIRGYNNLLRSKIFYEKFPLVDYVLICQLDVLVLKDNIDHWISLGYDNVGAPIFEDYSTQKSKHIKPMGSNGGFCMRKVKSCIKVLSKPVFWVSNPKTMWEMESNLPWKVFRLLRDGLIFNYSLSCFNPIINEDIFWSICVPAKHSWFKCCPPSLAAEFSFDTNPQYLYQKINNKLPMAIHAWWRYDKQFSIQLLQRSKAEDEMRSLKSY